MKQLVIHSRSNDKVIHDVFEELRKAEDKFPGFPEDPVHAVAVLNEESGEAMQAALDFYYHREENTDKLRKELCQTAAMAIRALLHLDYYKRPTKEKP